MTGLVFSLADAALTLKLTALGGCELNPVLRFYLELSPRLFVCWKYLFSVAGGLYFLKYQEYKLFCSPLTGRHLLAASAALYASCVLYQLNLLLG